MHLGTLAGAGADSFYRSLSEQGVMAAMTALGMTDRAIHLVKMNGSKSEPKEGVLIGICFSDCSDSHRQIVDRFLTELEELENPTEADK